ncbi:20237_t:CDS:2, partial [Racocetra persica]
NFWPGQDATVIKLLKKQGYQLLGKTALDDGGGSSSGSAVVVAKKTVPFALGHDTGDSVRRPAAYCGIVGFKPSYGLISRYGVIPMASSLDTIGILANKVSTAQEIFAILAQPDPHDLITSTRKKKFFRHVDRPKIATINGLEKFLPSELNKLYEQVQKKLEKLGYSITKINIPPRLRDNLQLTYLILCSTELVSHLNSLQGITYGRSEKLGITQKRSKYLGPIVKERTNSPAPRIADFDHSLAGLISSHWSDNLLLLGNLAGLPSLSLPLGTIDGLPVSINLNSAYGQDDWGKTLVIVGIIGVIIIVGVAIKLRQRIKTDRVITEEWLGPKRLELQKYFVFNLGKEIKQGGVMISIGECCTDGGPFIRSMMPSLTTDLTTILGKEKNFIFFAGPNKYEPDFVEWAAGNLDEKIKNGQETYLIFDKTKINDDN